MKKTLLTVLMLSILLPATLFAATPTDEEVYQATVAVLSVFGLVFMSSMFGEAPANVTMDMNMETGSAMMDFENFPVEDFTESMAEMMETTEEDPIVFGFSEMTGKILVNEAGNLNMDVTLTGGNVKTLVMTSEGEDIVSIEANGKSYNHLKEQLMNAGN
ncbi:hypothetical protein EXM22_10555 [Oceanispirochaeta crateris]|uniref:DUF4252 domain-containing protein n=1 Tax=Oceanispirochaeta crateris TaxID=2518645 RepID=A0A5C1QQK1_9SPIO|nr:hypothetical protein [Oceanispirochaeta crateris]QEN08402.1 hypothetical protein EXM22_10555 [Oceanispirochaeta crateris]